MKILYVDISLSGHHLPYLKALTDFNNDNIYILPEKTSDLKGKTYIIKYERYDIISYLKWIEKIYRIAIKEHVQVVHFVFGDVLYKSFGIGLGKFKKFKLIVSFHRMENKMLKNLSRILIMKKIQAMTTHIMGSENLLPKQYRYKIHFIAYPSVLENYYFTIEAARKYLNISTKNPVISVVGVMAEYKSLDVLFDALLQVTLPYYLVIAGKPTFYSEAYIKQRLNEISMPNTAILRFITDEEFAACIAAADIIAVPYSKAFEGTSGPMTEGIRLKKTIVGSEHSNIGEYIKSYKIGYSAIAGNIYSLTQAIENAIKYPVVYTEFMDKLIQSQTTSSFRKNMNNLY